MAYYILKSYKLRVDPFSVFAAFKDEKNSFFLDSSLTRGGAGRYSFIGADPFYVLKSGRRDPLPDLRKRLNEYRLSIPGNCIPFLGGALGYVTYDLGVGFETSVCRRQKESLAIPESYFAFYNTMVIIDNLTRKLFIFSAGFPEKKLSAAKALCESNFKKIVSMLSRVTAYHSVPRKYSQRRVSGGFRSNFSKEAYCRAVKKAKAYIKRGDIYQVNLSQRFCGPCRDDAVSIYERLRRISPSNFSAYFDAGDFQVLSSSPERFLSLRKDRVETSPMKGTRPRSKSKAYDLKLKKELLSSDKDRAELVMIVDLERNDLGRVCAYGSVKVKRLRTLEEYTTVFQTTATVEGRLRHDKDRVDLMKACFPGGSITGCPKIRAMEIIDELEPLGRSLYTGSLGYFSFSGEMDFNILIRTIVKRNNKVYFGVGGGIVADSDPEKEYRETLVKARAMFEAIT
ncbi:MAG: aminodeoxychorismate synthase component I [Candidatus Omnitrophota bacterium]|jgi:para-aminobenzoate synthetase component 1